MRLLHWWDLFWTLKPNTNAMHQIKLAAAPKFLGGPASKVEHMAPLLAKTGESYSTLFCMSSVFVPLTILRILKARGAHIIVNQNGVYYPSWYSGNYKRKNRYLRKLNQIADHSFFQSKFAIESYKNWVGPIPNTSSLLYNPVDLERFKPLTVEAPPDHMRLLVFTDFSEFNAELWNHVIAVKRYFDKNWNSPQPLRWVWVGRAFSTQIAALVKAEQDSSTNIEIYADPTRSQVLDELSKSTLALHLVPNDVCPNKVLEILASGVPVITGTNSGAAELISTTSGIAVSLTTSYTEKNFPSAQELLSSIETVLKNLPNFKVHARARASQFDIKLWHQKIKDLISSLNQAQK